MWSLWIFLWFWRYYEKKVDKEDNVLEFLKFIKKDFFTWNEIDEFLTFSEKDN